ncbi:MAG: putative porin, partial [Prevotella sp.]|nr:putative porin [Prevotella sp.]
MRIATLGLLMLLASVSYGQINEIDESGNITTRNAAGKRSGDQSGQQGEGNKEIPKGMKTWTVDEQFGDRTAVFPDTLQYMYMNTAFTEGLRGEYNTTGNKGAPRINRIFIDRQADGHFLFTQPYDYFITQPGDFHFTNTLSPFTNLSYNKCGDRTNGDDHFTAKFGVNAGKRLGFGFNFNYIYGRGYYDSQSTAHFNYTMYGSYLGDRYEAHLLMSTNHQKVTENGGITDDEYIVHPERFNESFQSSEIPTVLQENWNRNDNQHVFLTHRFNLGFNRKVPMTDEEIEAKKFAMASQKEEAERKEREKKEKQAREEGRELNEDDLKQEPTFAGRPDDAKIAGAEPVKTDSLNMGERIAVNGKAAADSLLAAESKAQEDTSWLKNEYVPVTSFIHTLKLDNYRRIYQAYDTPSNFYADTYYPDAWLMAGDSIYDQTKHLAIKNTFAISMLEGFNKWAKAGLKVFATSDLRHFTLPDTLGAPMSYKEHTLSIGGQLIKTQGQTLHYSAKAETWLIGEDAGQLKIDASADLNFRLFRDTVTLAARGFLYRLNPTFYYRHYHSKHLWWDNDGLDKIIHSRIEGLFS